MREEEKQFHINIKNEVGGVLASFFFVSLSTRSSFLALLSVLRRYAEVSLGLSKNLTNLHESKNQNYEYPNYG